MPRKSIVFYADENLCGHRIVAAMAGSGLEIRSILELVPRRTDDDIIAREIGGSRTRVLLTKDSHFVAKDVFRNAVIEHRVGVFYIANAGNLDAAAIAAIVRSQAKKILRAAKHESRPFMFGVHRHGLVRKNLRR